MKHDPFLNTDTLNEILLDCAVLLELSPHDRRIAENRYRLLKEHLERPSSVLRPFLIDGASRIYAQGSMATSTTIVSGTEDDRFDVDAVVEFDVPAHWTPKYALEQLFEALQGFPGADRIKPCTRCVQIQFPFMHMDVTILDRRARIAIERAGEIFHSPDKGPALRVPSNPWGFTKWFRTAVGVGEAPFAEAVRRRRDLVARSRLPYLDAAERLTVLARADQDKLPPMIPSALDSQEAVALKLLKRFINLHYQDSNLPKPPSIYLTKRAAVVGHAPPGLAAQLHRLAKSTAQIFRDHLANGTRPVETNPSYERDQINDRWPRAERDGVADMKGIATALEHLVSRLEEVAVAPLSDIAKAIDDLFGERIGKAEREVLEKRYDRRAEQSRVYAQPRTGAIHAPAIAVTPERLVQVPSHNFHPLKLSDSEDDQ